MNTFEAVWQRVIWGWYAKLSCKVSSWLKAQCFYGKGCKRLFHIRSSHFFPFSQKTNC